MKKPILFLAFLLAVFSAKAQFESLFGSDSTRWNITIGNLWGDGTAYHNVAGDTSFNGLAYKIIDGYGYYHEGYIREDTVLGKAWYRNNQDTTEYLIMDLQLSVGDSMYIGGNWNPYPGYHKVDSVYTINNRKHIQFNFTGTSDPNGDKFTLIEGISSTMGFRFQDSLYNSSVVMPKLLCSYKNGVEQYNSGRCVISGVEDVSTESGITVCPIPFEDHVTITFSENSNKGINYQLFDITGKMLISGNSTEQSFQIDNLNQLNNGTYFLVIENTEDQILRTVKLVK